MPTCGMQIEYTSTSKLTGTAEREDVDESSDAGVHLCRYKPGPSPSSTRLRLLMNVSRWDESRSTDAAQPAFTCGQCDIDFSQGKSRSHSHGDGHGRVCDRCYQITLLAKRPPFTCALCSRAVSRGKASHPQIDGDGRVCVGCYRKASKANRPPFTCALCSRAVSRGKVSHPQRDGDGRVCEACYRKCLASTREM
ncbi:unnamed product [Ostreococcus tauri]|uniref:Unnamed product n=1 Tax=Ostreococcus tauri TaxID=70448 RepID=A0A090M917_OSTTA|nr:unnamed product [Ostreococcus tauri]CEG01614.1 unnamed product [Ostreococcus tauri]|eukprot:XP_022841064.1 unnamed product [Ostreococcus tauri]